MLLLLLLLLLMRRRSLLLLLLQLHLNLQLLLLLMLVILIDVQPELRTFFLKRLIARLTGRVAQTRELGCVEMLRCRVVSEKKGTSSIINTLFYPAIEIHDRHSNSTTITITMKANARRIYVEYVLVNRQARVFLTIVERELTSCQSLWSRPCCARGKDRR